MRRILLSSALVISLGAISGGQSRQAVAMLPTSETPAVPSIIAQEPNQDSLQMTCTGSIPARNLNFRVFFTREAGFSRIQLSRPNGTQIAEAFLSYDRNNSKGQAVWRGSVNDMASITLVHLASRPARVGDQVSVKYDGQWGRGTCR